MVKKANVKLVIDVMMAVAFILLFMAHNIVIHEVLGLFFSFSIAVVSGILISQVIFPSGNVHSPLKALHILSAIGCIVFVVLHIRVHWGYLKSHIVKKFRFTEEGKIN